MHVRSLIATLVFIIGLVAGLFIYFLSPETLTTGQLITICVLSYIFYLLLAGIKNDLNEYLSTISHGINF